MALRSGHFLRVSCRTGSGIRHGWMEWQNWFSLADATAMEEGKLPASMDELPNFAS